MNTKARKTTTKEALRNTASALNALLSKGTAIPPALARFARRALARAAVALKIRETIEKVKPAEALREAASALQQVLSMAEQSADPRTWSAVKYGRLAMAQARAALGMQTAAEAR